MLDNLKKLNDADLIKLHEVTKSDSADADRMANEMEEGQTDYCLGMLPTDGPVKAKIMAITTR